MTWSRAFSAIARPSMIFASLMGGSLWPERLRTGRCRRSYAPAARRCHLFLTKPCRGGRKSRDLGPVAGVHGRQRRNPAATDAKHIGQGEVVGRGLGAYAAGRTEAAVAERAGEGGKGRRATGTGGREE